MYTVNTEKYAEILEHCYNKKTPLYVYGAAGVGKSEIPRTIYRKVAEKMKKEYLEWTDLTLDQKMECISSPEKYWIFCDQRISQMDSTDLRGIPNMINSDMLETIPMSWVVYFTQENASGAIFFDELNLAAPVVAGQAYQIINDRAIADRKLGKNVFVFGAGNRAGKDQAFVHEMPLPLKDRFCEFEIEPDIKSWTNWASGKVNTHLVAFVNWKNTYLHRVDENKAVKATTPRGITRASKLIEDMDITTNEVHMYISMSVGEAFATEFQGYVKHFKSLNWATLFMNPESVKGMSVDKCWAIVGGLAEHFGKLKSQADKKDSERFEQLMGIVENMPADFAIVGLRMIKDTDLKKFKSFLAKYKNLKPLADKYGKFIM